MGVSGSFVVILNAQDLDIPRVNFTSGRAEIVNGGWRRVSVIPISHCFTVLLFCCFVKGGSSLVLDLDGGE